MMDRPMMWTTLSDSILDNGHLIRRGVETVSPNFTIFEPFRLFSPQEVNHLEPESGSYRWERNVVINISCLGLPTTQSVLAQLRMQARGA